jgi:hypothetical protein
MAAGATLADKKYLLCKSSFVSSHVIVWQSAHSAAPFSRYHLFHHWHSVVIFAGAVFIIVIAALKFLLCLPGGSFIVIHPVGVSFHHCPFRA